MLPACGTASPPLTAPPPRSVHPGHRRACEPHRLHWAHRRRRHRLWLLLCRRPRWGWGHHGIGWLGVSGDHVPNGVALAQGLGARRLGRHPVAQETSLAVMANHRPHALPPSATHHATHRAALSHPTRLPLCLSRRPLPPLAQATARTCPAPPWALSTALRAVPRCTPSRSWTPPATEPTAGSSRGWDGEIGQAGQGVGTSPPGGARAVEQQGCLGET